MPKIDAIAYWPPKDRAYFFSGSNYVRYRLSGGEKAEGKVSLTEHYWTGLAFEDRIDAAVTVEPEGLVYFFRGDQFVPYRISSGDDEGALDQPRPIVSRYPGLPPQYQRDLDTVLYWPNNGRLYFFKEGLYLACDPVSGAPLQAERKIADGWTSLNFDRIDAAFVGKRDRAYFFRGEEYVAYSVSEDTVVGSARPWKDRWPAQRSSPDEKTLWELLSEGAGIPDFTLGVLPRLSFWQDLDPMTYPAAEVAEAREQRIGFANLAAMQAVAMSAFTDQRHYEGRQRGPIGPTAFRAGRDITEAIVNAAGATGQKVDRVHIFGHSNGADGLYGEHHEKPMGLYRTQFRDGLDATDPMEQQARVIDEIPKVALASDVVFLLHGCKMAEGGDNFARELCEFLTTGQAALDDAVVYAHDHSVACGQNSDWIRYSKSRPTGEAATMPAAIYHEFSAAENAAVDAVNRRVFVR
jgi:hypothetical protein